MRGDPAQSGVVTENLRDREVVVEADRLRHPAQAGPGHSVPTTQGDSALVRFQQTQQHLENINSRNYNSDKVDTIALD